MSSRRAPAVVPQGAGRVVLTGAASDAHTWNLVVLQMFLEERGHTVVNLGPCMPIGLLVQRCRAHLPDLVVISSVNGHGYLDGLSAIEQLLQCPELAGTPAVIGGRLGVDGRLDTADVDRLLAAGFRAVFADGDLAAFDRFLTGQPAALTVRPGAGLHVGADAAPSWHSSGYGRKRASS